MRGFWQTWLGRVIIVVATWMLVIAVILTAFNFFIGYLTGQVADIRNGFLMLGGMFSLNGAVQWLDHFISNTGVPVSLRVCVIIGLIAAPLILWRKVFGKHK